MSLVCSCAQLMKLWMHSLLNCMLGLRLHYLHGILIYNYAIIIIMHII